MDEKELLKMRMEGKTIREIADDYGVSYQAVQQKLQSYTQTLVETRMRRIDISKIKYKGIYEHFMENPFENYTSFAEKITSRRNSTLTHKIKVSFQGENESTFTIAQIKAMCKIVGKSFEETFEEYQNSDRDNGGYYRD